MFSKTHYFETIRNYVPEDAKKILNDQIPKIREAILDEVKSFGEKFSLFLVAEFDKAHKQRAETFKQARAKVDELLDQVSKSPAPDSKVIEKLRESIDDYEKRWKALGEGARSIALNALRAAGVPIPDKLD